jgi:hypothetical protein
VSKHKKTLYEPEDRQTLTEVRALLDKATALLKESDGKLLALRGMLEKRATMDLLARVGK